MQTVITVIVALLLPVQAWAQAAQAQNVEVDPVQCWWRTSVPSVRVGEQFTVHLTCSALESESTTAVIDRARLGTASVQFPPFEVTGGTQSADYVTAGRRFMQYHYNARLIAEDFFGSDIVLPALSISYRIESRVQQDAALQGREQTYELPALTMKINSLVANDANHIREAAVPTLDAIAGREFRARMFRVLALLLFGVAALTLAVALLGWVRRRRKQDMVAARHLLPNRAVLAGVRRQLADVRREVQGAGWSLDTVSRALAAARVVAGYAAGHVVSQREVTAASGGELLLSGGLLSRRRIGVSAAATAHALRDAATAGDLDGALTTLTAARYGRSDTYDAGALDDALTTVDRAADRVSSQHTWLAETARSIAAAVRGRAPRAWAR